MPLINIEYDDLKISLEDARSLSEAVCGIVSKATGINDVFAYTNTAGIKIAVAPVEIFVRMSASKISNRAELFEEIKAGLRAWKLSSGFPQPLNFTLIPMDWQFEVGI
jgi:hypothetical protein